MKLINIKNVSGYEYTATVELENNGTEKSINIVMNKILKKIKDENSFLMAGAYITVDVKDNNGNKITTMHLKGSDPGYGYYYDIGYSELYEDKKMLAKAEKTKLSRETYELDFIANGINAAFTKMSNY